MEKELKRKVKMEYKELDNLILGVCLVVVVFVMVERIFTFVPKRKKVCEDLCEGCGRQRIKRSCEEAWKGGLTKGKDEEMLCSCEKNEEKSI